MYGNRCRFVHSVVSENGLLGSSSFAPLLRLAPTGDSDTDLTDNQTNVNNECSGRNSPECSETGDKVVTDEKTSHHKELSELSSKVQSCSLLKNSESKKKKPGKKRNKKSTLKTRGRESKGKELVLAQKHVIKCGERCLSNTCDSTPQSFMIPLLNVFSTVRRH